jgi:hypothetical protein
VITLTCTVVALFFGSLFNMLVKKFEPKTESDTRFYRIKRIFRKMVEKIKNKKINSE